MLPLDPTCAPTVNEELVVVVVVGVPPELAV